MLVHTIIMNCNSQVCWRQLSEFARAVAVERGRIQMTNSTDISDVKMSRFGYRVDLIRERHVRVKDEAKIASRLHEMITLLR